MPDDADADGADRSDTRDALDAALRALAARWPEAQWLALVRADPERDPAGWGLVAKNVAPMEVLEGVTQIIYAATYATRGGPECTCPACVAVGLHLLHAVHALLQQRGILKEVEIREQRDDSAAPGGGSSRVVH